MDCNIRNVDAGLMRRMKMAALEEGLTLRQWCLKVFEQGSFGVEITAETLVAVKDGIKFESQFKEEEPNGNLRKERGKVESSQVQGGEVQKVQGGSKEDAPGGSKTEGEKASRKSAGAHDQKTCRVYRCSQCVAGGKKF